jgi:hypothetical protein
MKTAILMLQGKGEGWVEIFLRDPAPQMMILRSRLFSKTDLGELVAFIERRGGVVTVREVTQFYWPLKNQRGKAEAALGALVRSGLGSWEGIATTARGGRPTRQLRLLKVAKSIPIPGERPQPYSWWTTSDKQRFGFGNSGTKWKFTKRIGNGMSVAEAAADMGFPARVAEKYISKNPSFRARIKRVREWASSKNV